MRSTIVLTILILAFPGCVSPSSEPGEATLDGAQVAKLIPPSVRERRGWGDDIVAGLLAAKQPSTPTSVCAVIAIIQQESGFQDDPVVPELPRILHEGLAKKLAPLGVAAKPTLAALLALSPPGSKESFGERLAKLRTEQDLDRFFRDMQARYEQKMGGALQVASLLSSLLGNGSLADLNPITTAGPMQVKVAFARELLRHDGLSESQLRDYLYTRAGGVRVGTARLFSYQAGYDDIIYRLADYNAGVYSSRNAAFQSLISELSGRQLALDGDLLVYDGAGKPRSEASQSLAALLSLDEQLQLSDWRIRGDSALEKSHDFEDTSTWRRVRLLWEQKRGKKPPYARVPTIQLVSPKLRRPLSTSWFATQTKRHYQDCQSRLTKSVASTSVDADRL